MTAFMDHETTHLTLETLLPEPPDEVRAVAAERGLLEEARDELVVLDLVHVLLAQSSLAREAPRGPALPPLGSPGARALSVAAALLAVSHFNAEVF